MNKTAEFLLVLSLLTAPCLVMPLPVRASSKTFIVPDDYPTITAAVGNATTGDIIFVKKGTYEIKENSIAINKTLSIIGEDQTGTITVFPPDTRTGYEFFNTKIGFRVHADNFIFSNLTIDNCDLGIQAIGNGTQVSKISTTGISVSGSHSQIFNNALAGTLTVKGFFNNISDNTIVNVKCDGSYNNIVGNVYSGHDGQSILAGNFNRISKNSGLFLSLSNAHSNSVYNNSIYCLELRTSSNNTLFGNIIEGEFAQGIVMSDSSGNEFYGNYIGDYNDISSTNERRNGNGVNIADNSPLTQKNLFYCNNFINNFIHIRSNGISGAGYDWDNGSVGNYWDDYTGTDSNGDGIGDVQYTLKGWKLTSEGYEDTGYFGQDNYPLMAPFDIESVSLSLPDWTSPPSVHLISPENATYASANVTLEFTVNEQTSWMGYSLDGQETVTVASNTTLVGLSNGAHNVTVYAKDAFENMGNSGTMYFTVEVHEPFPTTLVLTASGISATVIGLGLLVYFKKRKR